MSAAGRFIRGMFYSGGGMVAALGSGLVALKLITNAPALTEADVGVYAMFVAGADFFVTLNSFGMRTALPKLLGGVDRRGQVHLTNATLTGQTAVSAALGLAILAVWLMAPGVAHVVDNPSWQPLWPVLWVLPLFVLLFSLRELLLAMHAGLHQYARRTVGLAVYAVAQVGLVVVFIWYAAGSLVSLLLVLGAANAVAVVVLLFTLGVPVRLVRDLRPWREGTRFARPLWINNLFGFAFNRMDTLIVGALLGPAAAGVFDIGAKRLPQYAVSVLNASLVPFLPSIAARIAHDDHPGAMRLLMQVYSMFAFVGYAGLLFTLVVQAPLVRLVFSEAYLGALPALGWMMAAGVLTLQAGIFGQALIALGRPRPIAIINIVLAGVSLGLNALLIPRFGIIGAGYAAVSAITLSHVLHAACVRMSGLPFGLWGYLRPHANLVTALLLGWGLGYAVAESWAAAAALGLFVVASFVTGLVTPGQMQRVLHGLRRG